jgi:hypothetical protein
MNAFSGTAVFSLRRWHKRRRLSANKVLGTNRVWSPFENPALKQQYEERNVVLQSELLETSWPVKFRSLCVRSLHDRDSIFSKVTYGEWDLPRSIQETQDLCWSARIKYDSIVWTVHWMRWQDFAEIWKGWRKHTAISGRPIIPTPALKIWQKLQLTPVTRAFDIRVFAYLLFYFRIMRSPPPLPRYVDSRNYKLRHLMAYSSENPRACYTFAVFDIRGNLQEGNPPPPRVWRLSLVYTLQCYSEMRMNPMAVLLYTSIP